MATKTLKKKVQAKPAASKFAAPVVDSVRDVWLAGLGVVAVAREESEKLLEEGGKLFDRFVQEGTRFEGRTRDVADETVGDIREGVGSTVDSLRRQAADRLDRIEDVFSVNVSDTLRRLGIPTGRDLDDVSARIQKMSAQVDENWKGLNRVIDRRVRAVLKKLDVPLTDDLDRLADRLKRFSRETVDNLVHFENSFEKRVSGILKSMNLPTADDIERLSGNIAQLSRRIAELEKSAGAAGKGAA